MDISHIGISIGTDMIFGGIGQWDIHSTIGVIGTMDGDSTVTHSIMDTDTILTWYYPNNWRNRMNDIHGI